MYVFVYGTLKRDEPNAHWLENGKNGSSTFFAKGRTVEKFPLVIASRYNIPFLVDQPGTGKNIEGEVYEIDEKMLANLDILEEYPKLYTRRQEPIIIKDPTSDSKRTIEAWTYLLNHYREEMLSLPFLDNYSSTGPHNLPYLVRYLRDATIDHRAEVKHLMNDLAS